MKQGHDTPARPATRATYAIMLYAAMLRDCRLRREEALFTLEAARFKLGMIAVVYRARRRSHLQLAAGQP